MRAALLRRLTSQVLAAPDLRAVARVLTRELPAALGITQAQLLLWNRRLDSFEVFTPGETYSIALRPEKSVAPAPEARFLLSEGVVLETPGNGDGMLVPLQARSGLVGMLVLGARPRRRGVPLGPVEARATSLLAARAALSIENLLYQRELIASERMAALGTMAGMLAHDFRNPMTVIRGYAETLLDPTLPHETVRARAEMIIEMIDRLDRMTAETLDFARDGGRLARRPATLVSALEDLAHGLAEELPGLEVVREFSVPAAVVAHLDTDKLQRAAGNIAANARDAMGGSGRLHMQARLAGSDAFELVLADEGPGIPDEIRERLFEPFVTQGKKTGTGLGLAVARRFVEDHGGTVELLPDGPGARFRLLLPLQPPLEQQ